jgi:hypothetical protein
MPRDVAMQRPDTGVILVPLENNVAGGDGCAVEGAGLHELDVTALSVVWVGDGAVPFADAFGEDVEVVAVEMLGVELAL